MSQISDQQVDIIATRLAERLSAPTGVKSKKVNDFIPASRRASLTRMFGGVPI